MSVKLSRILRHLFGLPGAVARALPAASLARIERAIEKAEAEHRGEIRFAVEAALESGALLSSQSSRSRALEVFSLLRVWDTEENNGVLIYLLLADRAAEIVADRGIHAKVAGRGVAPDLPPHGGRFFERRIRAGRRLGHRGSLAGPGAALCAAARRPERIAGQARGSLG